MPLLFSNKTVLPDFRKNWLFRYLFGIVLILIGIAAVYASVVATMITVVILGAFLLATGVIGIFDSFLVWWQKSGFWLHLIMGILYFIAGAILFFNPEAGSLSLTWLLAIVYLIVGTFRMVTAWQLHLPRWGWVFFNGLLAFVLGVLILSQWPQSGLFIIGLFVGIDLIFAGFAYLTAASAARSMR